MPVIYTTTLHMIHPSGRHILIICRRLVYVGHEPKIRIIWNIFIFINWVSLLQRKHQQKNKWETKHIQLSAPYLESLSDVLPLISTSCSSDKGWPFIGSVPFSAMYFSISLRSNTWLDTGETHGCSGTSFETMIKHNDSLKSYTNNNTTRNKLAV